MHQKGVGDLPNEHTPSHDNIAWRGWAIGCGVPLEHFGHLIELRLQVETGLMAEGPERLIDAHDNEIQSKHQTPW